MFTRVTAQFPGTLIVRVSLNTSPSSSVALAVTTTPFCCAG
jgi:hypothetical protein